MDLEEEEELLLMEREEEGSEWEEIMLDLGGVRILV